MDFILFSNVSSNLHHNYREFENYLSIFKDENKYERDLRKIKKE